MNPIVNSFWDFIEKSKKVNNKDILINNCVKRFSLIKDRSVYHCDYFAVRFSYSKNGSFSNVVLSLSSLEKYDTIPFFSVLVIGNADNVVYLANTTFLSKISHSSQELTMTNIRGSFLGSNIIKEYDGIKNVPANFEILFALHQGLSWSDNLQRLVEASSKIKPISTRFDPDQAQLNNIYHSVDRAKRFLKSDDYATLLCDLNQRCEEVKLSILAAAHIENVNIRGRLIEALITASPDERLRILSDLSHIEQSLPTYDTRNGLSDYTRHFDSSDTYTDIKTKIVYLNSNPKMYNIDKFLQCMAEEKSVFLFFFIAIDEKGIPNTALCTVFHPLLLQSVHLQQHWAGRSTRGTAQASGDAINKILNSNSDYHKAIDTDLANNYIACLLNR